MFIIFKVVFDSFCSYIVLQICMKVCYNCMGISFPNIILFTLLRFKFDNKIQLKINSNDFNFVVKEEKTNIRIINN